MDTKQRLLTVGEVAADINISIANPGTLKAQMVQTLVQEEPLEWRKELATAFRNDTALKQKIKNKLAIPAPSPTGAIPAARRYYLCDGKYADELKIKNVPHYGPYTPLSTYNQLPLSTVVQKGRYEVVKKNDVYRDYMPHSFYDPALISPEALPGTALADYPNASLEGLEHDELNPKGVTLFYLKTLGEEEDLAPLTNTLAPSWTHNGSTFQINPENDYHFGFDFNVMLTCSEESTRARVIDQRVVDMTSTRIVNGNLAVGRCEVAVYARLHNGPADDSAQLSKLNDRWMPFTKLNQASWLIKDVEGNSTRRTIRLQGGFRLRSIIDDYISAVFMYSDGALKDRAYFRNVDILLSVTSVDTFTEGGPIVYRLVQLPSDTADKSNFIDIIDLGASGVKAAPLTP